MMIRLPLDLLLPRRQCSAPTAGPVSPATGGSATDRLTLSAAVRSPDALAHLRRTVERIAATAPGEWTANDGYCMDLSAKWQAALRAAGIETRLIVVDPTAGQALASTLSGRSAMGKTHAFLSFEHQGEEYILDATVQQFFEGPAGAVPAIFLGTRDEAAAMFTREQARLQIEIGADANKGRHDPLAFTELVYGFGRYRSLRVELGD